MRVNEVIIVALLSCAAASGAAAVDRHSLPEVPARAERAVYYGDLAIYSTYSFSAYMEGVRTTPDEAYRFARGQPVMYQGREVRRTTAPLDFLAITDQAENLGLFNTLDDPNSAFSQTEIGRQVRAKEPKVFARVLEEMLFSRSNPYLGVETSVAKAATQRAWQRTIDAANRNYQPGQFTTFIAYHWTAYRDHDNLHRNVIFRGDRAPYPFTAIESVKPEDLWSYLEASRARGAEALAIPHDSHLSNGVKFDWVDSEGRPIDRAHARRRIANEPLVEIASLGQSETHPTLSPADPFASFELFGLEKMQRPAGSYVRDALGRGIQIAQKVGVNPYHFGFVGGTHYGNGLSDSAESAYNGRRSPITFEERFDSTGEPSVAADLWSRHISGAGSLTAVWAEQNTRESIYAALRRGETFATSGTRLRVRFFGSWEYESDLLQRKNWIERAYRKGVPMGSDLTAAGPVKRAPRFAFSAAKDPAGANLDRVQIIKIAVVNGVSTEQIYDVATANDGQGAAKLSGLWKDARFDAEVPAAYYVRVLEVPTPRWSTTSALRRRQPPPDNVPEWIQERAWSSPIWLIPAPK